MLQCRALLYPWLTEILYKLLKSDFSEVATGGVSPFQTACLRSGCLIYENIVGIANYVSAVSCEVRNSQQFPPSQRGPVKK